MRTLLKHFLLVLLLLVSVATPSQALAFDVQFPYTLIPTEAANNSVLRNQATMGNVKSNPKCTEVGTSTTKCAVSGKLAGWPTNGVLTQGPLGAFSHLGIYRASGGTSEGVDIAAVLARPIPDVYPTFTGTVDTVYNCRLVGSCNLSYGSYVKLADTAKTFTILYGHLEKIYTTQGANVTRKDALGLMGTTGNSTGIHLHWEFRNIRLATPNIPDDITPPDCNGNSCRAGASGYVTYDPNLESADEPTAVGQQYWFSLDRVSKKEYLYFGEPGNKATSELRKTFNVNPGRPGERPTPLPQKVNSSRPYWLITQKQEVSGGQVDSLGKYFLIFDVPYQNANAGPTPYLECGPGGNQQCNWVTPGEFGMHGINGHSDRLTDAGSSGCVRHSDADIEELYNLIDLNSGPIRYYIEDNSNPGV